MKLSKMLSMIAIAERVGGIARAALVGIATCYTLEKPPVKEEVHSIFSEYFNGNDFSKFFQGFNFYRNKG